MTPFLQTVAQDLYAKTNGRFDNVTIIFPNKRAGIFFNQYLHQLNGGQPMWLPRYATITDIFSSLSRLTLLDPITLVCRLHQSYAKVNPNADTLDRFYSWGEVMLQDFDDIDNNMICARNLFTNVSDLNALTDLSFMSEAQQEAIRTYFSNFNPQHHTKLKDKFISLWDILLTVYEQFRTDLEATGDAYEGMLKRNVAETLQNTSTALPQLDSHLYAVVGFNVLNKTEKTLFRYLKKHHTTRFYWDYAPSFLTDDNFEAGRFIKQNLLLFGDALEDSELQNSATTQTDTSAIHILAASTENAQARYVAQWLKQTVNSCTPLNRTAVVLCNESLLQSVVHSIPATINNSGSTEEINIETNITMGFPLMETSAASFLQSLLTLQLSGQFHTRNTWHHDKAVSLLRHPFVAHITDGLSTRIIADLKKRNIVYPSTQQLTSDHPFLLSLFTPQTTNEGLLHYLATTFETIGKSLKTLSEEDKQHRFLNQLHMESVFNMYTIINRLSSIYHSGILQVTPYTLSRLILQSVTPKSVPFHGEPATGIQLMGMLETRNLDFDNIIILSANEGNLPKSDHITSLIPYTLREAYGMTTIEARTSLYAYYFYRLLQRAGNVHILYNTSSDTLGRGEMSRFLLQLTLENQRMTGGRRTIHHHQLIASSTPMGADELRATKSGEMMKRLQDKYTTRPLTPSAINTYIDCPLKFYLSRLSPLSLAPLGDIDEDIDNAQFGDIVHHVMEAIYKPYVGRTLTADIIETIRKDHTGIGRLVDEELYKILHPTASAQDIKPSLRLTGQQLLNRHVIISYIIRQLEADTKACPLRIVSLEDESHSLILKLDERISVTLSGIIDRLDTTTIDGTQHLRVVDYKTSSTPHKAPDIHSLFDNARDHRPYHILQALVYSLILAEEGGELNANPIAPSLFYLKQTVPQSTLDPVVSIGKEKVTDFANHTLDDGQPLRESLTQSLRNVLSTLFSETADFPQASNPHLCEYCDFKELCMSVAPKA